MSRLVAELSLYDLAICIAVLGVLAGIITGKVTDRGRS